MGGHSPSSCASIDCLQFSPLPGCSYMRQKGRPVPAQATLNSCWFRTWPVSEVFAAFNTQCSGCSSQRLACLRAQLPQSVCMLGKPGTQERANQNIQPAVLVQKQPTMSVNIPCESCGVWCVWRAWRAWRAWRVWRVWRVWRACACVCVSVCVCLCV